MASTTRAPRAPAATGLGARLTAWLQVASPALFASYATLAAFSAYFAMYAFRKPFAAATFEGERLAGLDLKVALLIGQVLGYALSKLLSIRILSELAAERRARALVVAIGVSHAALLGLALLPPAGQVLAMFVNGLPLGAVWGLVFSFLEGRRSSEVLGAGLSMSYIVASGAVKGVGRWLVQLGVGEAWMPFLVGALFLPVMLGSIWLLARIPPPGPDDVAERASRGPMDMAARRAFFWRHAPGLLTLTALYVLLTAFRDFRDNFAVELWAALGHAEAPAVLAWSELPVAAITLGALALIVLVRDSRTAFFVVHGVMALGALAIGVSTWLFQQGLLGGTAWMIVVGTGLYLGYVPFGCVLFDRLMAMTRSPGTAVFMIYVTDASGYLGSVSLLLLKSLGRPQLPWLEFFVELAKLTALGVLFGLLLSALYFARVGRVESAAA